MAVLTLVYYMLETIYLCWFYLLWFVSLPHIYPKTLAMIGSQLRYISTTCSTDLLHYLFSKLHKVCILVLYYTKSCIKQFEYNQRKCKVCFTQTKKLKLHSGIQISSYEFQSCNQTPMNQSMSTYQQYLLLSLLTIADLNGCLLLTMTFSYANRE